MTNAKFALYPQPIAHRGGCKVAWLTYDNEADARTAASVAAREADELESRGFDFGFAAPGSIRHDTETGTYIVCIP